MTFKLYNSITKQTESFSPKNPDSITFYSCGPTVYDDAHIGNFRSFLAADLLRRWVESPMCKLQTESGEPHSGPRTVTHVMNITDVGHMTDDDNADGGGEDKMEVAAQRIKQAQTKKDGSVHKAADIDPNDPRAIARFYENRFKEDAIALGLKVVIEAESDPSLMPRASEHVEQMKQVIVDLLNNNHAYAAGQPGSRAVYFNTQTFPNYGSLSGNTLNQLKGGAGGRVDESQQSEKKHPADFLLWKEDATHKMKWDAPDHPDCNDWDQGYPGWHIECTAMALARLVPGGLDAARATHATIDLHSGGEDNIFPHHECEIAQSCCFTHNQSFARHWFHARFLKVNGEKMSKSKGTMYKLADLSKKGRSDDAVRFLLISTHYRKNADFSIIGLVNAQGRIDAYRGMASNLQSLANNGWLCETNIDEIVDKFTTSMSNDLNIAEALAPLNGLKIHNIRNSSGNSIMDFFRTIQPHNEILPGKPMDPQAAYEIYNDPKKSQAEKALAAFHLIDNILGVIFKPMPKSEIELNQGVQIEHRVQYKNDDQKHNVTDLILRRSEAKKQKDFNTADNIRDQLSEMGFQAIDQPPKPTGEPSVIVDYKK